MNQKEHPKPTLTMALLPIVLTIGLLMIQLFVFDDFTPHTPLALGILITGLFAWRRGYRWDQMEKGIFRLIAVGMPAVAILLVIGMIIGTWILSGTVPTLIYYGLEILSPGIFLFAGCLVCAIISISTGTSWGTTGTVGLALIGIGDGLGIPSHITAGAVVSGAFFGDKMSPLSDTTNLAPAVCGTDLWSHIRSMVYTSGPAMLIALGIYAWLGMGYAGGDMQSDSVDVIRLRLDENFNLTLWTLIPPALVLVLAVKRMPALPSVFAGVVFGGFVAMIFQGSGLHDVLAAMHAGYMSDTGVKAVDDLLSKGGIKSMTWIITLVLIALGFGGILERTRCLEVVLEQIIKLVKGRFSLVAASTGSSVGTNILTGDVYLSIVLPGRMFAPAYRDRGYSTTILSRSVEDGGTLISPLVPWNVGGAFVAGALGVSTLSYVPFAFACWMSPIIGLVWAATGWFTPAASDEERRAWKESGEMDDERNSSDDEGLDRASSQPAV